MNVAQWIKKNGPLTPTQRVVRSAVRNFLLVATPEELFREAEIHKEEDPFRSCCVEELIEEMLAIDHEATNEILARC